MNISGIKRNLTSIANKTKSFLKAGLTYQEAMGLECHTIKEWHEAFVKADDTPKVVEETIDETEYNLKAYKQFFNWLRATGEMPFSYVQSSKYINVYLNRDKFVGLSKEQIRECGLSNNNTSAQFAKFEFTEDATPEMRVEEWTTAQEVKAAAAEANAPAERSSSTVKAANDTVTSGFQVSWVLDEHGSTEDALVGLMNILVAKYSRKVSVANITEIVLRESEAVTA